MKFTEFVESVVSYLQEFPDAGDKDVIVYNSEFNQTYPIDQVDADPAGFLQIGVSNEYDEVPEPARATPDAHELAETLTKMYEQLEGSIDQELEEIRVSSVGGQVRFEVAQKLIRKPMSGLKGLTLELAEIPPGYYDSWKA